MDFDLDDDQKAIIDAVDAVCAQFDDPYWAACDREHRFPWDFYDAMAEGGWVGIAIPEQFGGGGRGITEAALVLNRIAASGAAMNGSTPVHLTMFGLNPVVKFGNDRLRETFLPRAAAGELHVAFGVTEPDAGTDTSRITTRAVDDGTGGFVVTGRKIWTSKALESEVCLLLARTDDAPPDDRFGGLSLFLVDLDPDHVDIRPIPKLGRNAVASCEVAYDGLPVEGWRLVGERGRGFRQILHGLNPERILLAAVSCGIGEVAVRRAVAYAGERVVFDRPIGANQAIAHPLAAAHVHLRAAYLSMLEAAWRYDRDMPCGEHANSAKYLAAEACWAAADQAVQTHGGLGYATEYHVERYWREARLQRLAPVSQEMTLPSRCSACRAATDRTRAHAFVAGLVSGRTARCRALLLARRLSEGGVVIVEVVEVVMIDVIERPCAVATTDNSLADEQADRGRPGLCADERDCGRAGAG